MAVHVLDQLDLFGMEVETPFHGRGIYLVPFVLRQEPVFMSETPEYDLVFPVALEHSPFIVLQELPEVLFGPESLFEALVQVACVRTRVLCQIILSPCFRGEIAVERVRLGIGP